MNFEEGTSGGGRFYLDEATRRQVTRGKRYGKRYGLD
jgi:hypothetical protein